MAAELEKKKFTYSSVYFLLALVGLIAVQSYLAQRAAPKEVPYSEFLQRLDAGEIAEVRLTATEIIATLRSAEGEGTEETTPQRIVTERLPGIDESPILESLRDKGVSFSGRIESVAWWETLLYAWFLPLAFIFGIYYFAMRRLGGRSGPLSFGKNRAKIHDESQTDHVTFDDVAGVEEVVDELREVVDFLTNPQRYSKIGARIPKGVLLVGPPGTGKTLLAKAVAGEAGVPFFSLSGSEFVEMFVGVGAARMRDLFEQAKARAPCIVFIDELDAIGKSRGGLGAMATHDEREQTLNQLLVEMDGFDTEAGVVIMAATNRPEVLDPALVRAGRFDRQVLVDRPDLQGRHDILAIHCREIQLSEDVDLMVVARRTPGMTGADLANVVNEAALAAARRGAQIVEKRDFEEATDRIQLGLVKRGRVMNEEEKTRVAYHEGGHTLVALSVEHADPVHRVTIIPRSIGSLGATLQLPTEERYLMTRDELLDRICVMLGGRVAEELTSDDISTGAQNDLERATETARQMVCRFGMSDKLGPQTFGRPVGAQFLQTPVNLGEERNFSERTAQVIDDEVRAIIQSQHERARKILEDKRSILERIFEQLLERETLEREDLDAILKGEPVPAS